MIQVIINELDLFFLISTRFLLYNYSYMIIIGFIRPKFLQPVSRACLRLSDLAAQVGSGEAFRFSRLCCRALSRLEG